MRKLIGLFVPEEHIEAGGDSNRCLDDDRVIVHREPTLGVILSLFLFLLALLLHLDPQLFRHSDVAGLGRDDVIILFSLHGLSAGGLAAAVHPIETL